MEGTQGRKPEAGTESETKEEHFLLACSPWLAHYVYYTVQTHLPRDGTAHSGPGSLTSINNQKNDPIDISTGQPDTVPSPKWLYLIKLTKTNQYSSHLALSWNPAPHNLINKWMNKQRKPHIKMLALTKYKFINQCKISAPPPASLRSGDKRCKCCCSQLWGPPASVSWGFGSQVQAIRLSFAHYLLVDLLCTIFIPPG